MSLDHTAQKKGANASIEPQELFVRLRTCSDSAFDTYSTDLMHRLARALGANVLSSTTEGRTRLCLVSRPDLFLRGFSREDTAVLILGDGDQTWPDANSSFFARLNSPLDMPLIVGCSDAAAKVATEKVGGHFACVLRESDVTAITTAQRPLEAFQAVLRKRFPVNLLHPFDHHHPTSDFGFLGRREVLDQIKENPYRNYALIGPSKMGKTSLIMRHYIRHHGSRSAHCNRVYVDLYNVAQTDDAVARALRMAIDPSATAYYDDPAHFPAFLQKACGRFGGSFEIVLDEVDKHCGLQFIRTLIHLAQGQTCRIILIGRWRLMREAVYSHDDNLSRLDPLILGPLDVDDATELLERPLCHLGYPAQLLRHELRSAVNRLGRVPGHVQEFGCILIEELAFTGNQLTAETVRRALARTITHSRLCGLLDDLSSAAARAAALFLIFSPTQGKEADALWLRDQFAQHGVTRRTRDCMEILDELVIHHFVIREKGAYHINSWDVVAEGQAERKIFEEMLKEELHELVSTK